MTCKGNYKHWKLVLETDGNPYECCAIILLDDADADVNPCEASAIEMLADIGTLTNPLAYTLAENAIKTPFNEVDLNPQENPVGSCGNFVITITEKNGDPAVGDYSFVSVSNQNHP